MVTMIKCTITSKEAEQIHLGDATETLSNRKRQLRSIMVGDFNARDEMWCIDHNKEGRLLNE